MFAIETENLSKRYRLYHAYSLRSFLKEGLKPTAYWWALKNISFALKEGEILSVLGRNGAGKSTLLKVLSKVTQPTEGFCRVKPRVGSLLSSDMGFHPDLTARENIFFTSAMHGFSKKTVLSKQKKIEVFSGIEQWLLQPVKKLSQGQKLRLSMAILLELDFNVLLLDEYWSQLDALFLAQCFERIESLRQNGSSIAMVCHQQAFSKEICTQALVLDKGHVSFQGSVEQAWDQALVNSSSEVAKPRSMSHFSSGTAFLEAKDFSKPESQETF